jgi:hypothetical protein
MLRATSALRGCAIQAKDGKAGRINDVLFDQSTWTIRWLVVETGSWASGRLVLIHPASVDDTDGRVATLHVSLTKGQITESPNIYQDPPVSRQFNDGFGGDDGGAGYWEAQGLAAGASAYPYLVEPWFGETAQRDQASDPNLRSAFEMSGYHVHAVDGDIGHLVEFLIDDTAWVIRTLVLDTHNWFPGPHVMVAPAAVVEIDFLGRGLRLKMTREAIRSSPPAWQASAVGS